MRADPDPSAPRVMPIDASMAMRLHESGGEEDQARLVYALCVCLDRRERWIARAFKRPAELMRWGMAGFERWGLAEEFEPMRRLARAEMFRSVVDGARGRVNDSLRPRLSHLAGMASLSPRQDHVYWAALLAVGGLAMWGCSELADALGQSRGAWARWATWAAGAAAMSGALKAAVYIWQDSSSSMGEGLACAVWGRSPQEDAVRAMACVGGSGTGADGGDAEPRASAELAAKARRGALSALDALELSRVASRAKAWREDWAEAQERLARQGAAAIEESRQPGWALARLERADVEGASPPPEARAPLPGASGRARL